MRPPEWHRRRAEQLAEFVAAHGDQPNRLGILVSGLALARQQVAQIIEGRQRTGVVTFHVEIPRLSP
jgi:hypothetical protein